MTIRACAVLVSLVVSACGGGRGGGGGGESDAEPAGCAALEGTYELGFVELEGTCGPQDAATAMFDGRGCETSDVGACTGSRICSADRCSIAIDIRCPLDMTGTNDVLSRGAITVERDASRASGELELQVVDNASGAEVCFSRYAVVYTRR